MIIKQDLHIHTIYSSGDSAVVPEQTIELIAEVGHAEVMGISDHLEYLADSIFVEYQEKIKKHGLKVGCEVNGADWVDRALALPTDYYVYHCWNEDKHYKGLNKLLSRNVPVIVAHPMALETQLGRVPNEAYIEINNRYIWQGDWRTYHASHIKNRQFVYSSDAHQPNWLNQTMARFVGKELGIKGTVLFDFPQQFPWQPMAE